MSTSIQSLLTQATDAVKEFLGMESNYPQAQVTHDVPYLDDIAKGNWGTLRPVKTNERFVPVVGFPLGFTWSQNLRKVNTNFVRYPFLREIRQAGWRWTLRQTKTVDKTHFILENNYKLRPTNRKALLSEIQSFNPSKQLNKVENNQPGLVSKAKDFVKDKMDGMKETLGLGIYPQSAAEHDQPWLNDIARGNWKSLNPVKTNEKTVPVVGVPLGFEWFTGLKFKTNIKRGAYLEQIKDQQLKNLKHVETIDKSKLNWGKEFRLKKTQGRADLMQAIRGYQMSNLKQIPSQSPGLMDKAKQFIAEKMEDAKDVLGMDIYPQANIKHEKDYLNTIANGEWKLQHVEEVKESNVPVVGVPGDYMMQEGFKLRPAVDRMSLIKEVEAGCDLKHVQTVEKDKVYIEDGFKLKAGVDRKQLMDEIRGFEGIGSS